MNTAVTPTLTETVGTTGATYTFSAWSTTTNSNDTATWTHTTWLGHDAITIEIDGAENVGEEGMSAAEDFSFTTEYVNGVYFSSGVQCTSVYDWRCNVSISQVADSCKIVIGNTGGGNVTAVENMDDIQIYHAGSLIFRGLADSVNIEGMGGNKIVITGIGYIKLLMQRFVTESYAAKSRSYMVGDILTNYAPALTGTNVAATSESLTRVIKARSAFDAIDELAGELEYDFWVDTDLDLHWLERSYEASGVTITNGTTTVFSVTLPQRSETIYNKVRVYGDVNAGGGQPVTECIDPASILHYGYTKEADPIHDNSLQTVPECYARGQTFIDRSAWGDPTIMLETPGQYTLQPGTTVELVGFETDYGVIDGSYLVMEKAHSIKTGRTMLTIAKYDSTTEDMIADIIRRVRRKEYEDLDHTATVTKYILAYEDLELEGYTLKVYNIGMGQSMIMGHSTNGIMGNTTDNIVMGNSGRSISLDIEVTET